MGIETAIIASLVASTAASTVSGMQANKAEASQMRRKATLEKKSALHEEKQFRQSTDDRNAASRAKIAASGVELSGSAQNFMDRNVERQEMDALTIRYGGYVKSQQSLFGSKLADNRAKATLFSGISNIGGTILGSTGKGGEEWQNFLVTKAKHIYLKAAQFSVLPHRLKVLPMV